MAERKKPKAYVVWQGLRTGIFDTWDQVVPLVSGYPGAKYKGFPSRQDAEEAFRGRYWDYVSRNPATGAKPGAKSLDGLIAMGVIADSIAVDAACSGVPGPMEYRGVYVATGEEIFHKGPYDEGTNNVGEFLGIVHALGYLRTQGKPDMAIYSDSVNAQLWVRARTCRTKLIPTPRNAPIFELLTRAVRWLKENEVTNPILKWETDKWGEIPADFGRK